MGIDQNSSISVMLVFGTTSIDLEEMDGRRRNSLSPDHGLDLSWELREARECASGVLVSCGNSRSLFGLLSVKVYGLHSIAMIL